VEIRFDLAVPARILFAQGAAAQLRTVVKEQGSRALVVTGSNPERYQRYLGELDAITFPIATEPTLDHVRLGCRVALAERADVIVGIGGGSAIDAAKAIAILATNSGEPLDYLEVIGDGRKFDRPGLPFIAVPTTAGAGAEATRNAVLSCPERGLKASLRHSSMLAKVSIVDPELTVPLPASITAFTGLDALTQLIEPFVSSRANYFTDILCIEGMKLVRNSLEAAYKSGDDRAARAEMSYASLLGGVALSNAGLGVVHGFAAPLGGMMDAHHGEICAALLAHGVAANVREGLNVLRYQRASRILSGTDDGLVPWLNELTHKLRIRNLGQLGLRREQIPEIVEKAAQASSMKANPGVLTAAQLRRILEDALNSVAATI
jgi:alcohol dehydrogenase class IV